MSLKVWQNKIIQRRKKSSFKDFLMEIATWTPLVFYKNRGMISKYPKSSRVNICSIKEFESIRDELIKYGKSYDFSLDFFVNFKKLYREIPHSCLAHVGNNENSDFSDTVVDGKNVYLSNIITLGSENVFYSMLVRVNSKNVFNSLFVVNYSELVYFSNAILSSFKVFFSRYINNCNNVWFSTNLTGCMECLFCENLQNVSYCINNKKLTKEEYFEQKKIILKQKKEFLNWYKKLTRKGTNHNSTNVKGNFIQESENVIHGETVFNLKNGKNILLAGSTTGGKNWMDFCFGGEGNNDIFGVCSSGGGCNHIYMSTNIGYCSNIYYCQTVEHCSYCIGCVGLKNKSYCILNKQYSKEEWEQLATKIFHQMERDTILGKSLPGDINPYYLNDTVGGLIGKFSKKEAEEKGYMWRNQEIKTDIPSGVETVEVGKLSHYQGFDKNGDWKINGEILKKVIIDKSGNYYKIIEDEYNFLVKYSLPIPELHWIDRMKLNLGV